MAIGALSRIPFCYDPSTGKRFELTREGLQVLDALIRRTGGDSEAIDVFDAVAPTTTRGDLIVHDGAGNTRQPAGPSGYFVRYDASSPTGVTAGTAVTSISVSVPASGLTVAGGTITTTGTLIFGLANDLSAVEGLTNFGITARTAADTWTVRSITGTANQVIVTNGDGVAGNPVLSLPQNIHSAATPTFAGLTLTAPLGIASGGTGQATANAALNALLPAQGADEFLTSDGTDASFRALATTDLPVRPSFSVHKNGTDQTGVATGTLTKVTWSTADWDTTSGFDFTNSRFLPTVPGKYRLSWAVPFSGGVDQTTILCRLRKNGVDHKDGVRLQASGTGGVTMVGSVLVDANGTDYFELFAFQASGSNQTISGSTLTTFFQGIWESN